MVSGQKKDSRVKKKGKLVLAKNKKQAYLALVILVLFFANSIYMGVKYLMEKNAQQNPPQANNTIGQQQQNLESLTNMPRGGAVEGGQNQNLSQDPNDIYSQTLNSKAQQNGQNLTTPQGADEDIEIITKKSASPKSEKMVLITVASSGRSNPFLPANENVLPESLSYLTTPPETLPKDTDTSKIMTTTISGILYDKYSPSAIINIEGTDYLVKVGDIINHYKVLSIDKIQVIVKLGQNVYKAGVGELLSQTGLEQNNIANLDKNNVANLNKKFGGNTIPINVKKKGY